MTKKTSGFYNNNNNKIINIEQNPEDRAFEVRANDSGNQKESGNEYLDRNSKMNNTKSKNLVARGMGIRLKIIRVMTGLNLKEFGSLCKIESGMFGRYERGETPLSVASSIKVAVTVRDLYQIYIDPNWILNGEGVHPFKIAIESQDKQTAMVDILNKYSETYENNEAEFDLFDGEEDDLLIKQKSLIAGISLDLSSETQLAEIINEHCLIIKKSGESIIAICTYDTDERIFSIRSDRKLFSKAMKIEDIAVMKKIFFIVHGEDAAEKYQLYFKKQAK